MHADYWTHSLRQVTQNSPYQHERDIRKRTHTGHGNGAELT